MSGLILADKVYVGPLVFIEDRFAEVGGGDRPVIPGFAVEIIGDLGRQELSPVAGKDLVARQAALLPGQFAQIGLRQIAAVAFGKQILTDGRGRGRGSRRGRFDRKGRGGGRRFARRGGF